MNFTVLNVILLGTGGVLVFAGIRGTTPKAVFLTVKDGKELSEVGNTSTTVEASAKSVGNTIDKNAQIVSP